MSILTREEFSEILDCYAMRAISGYVGGVIGANPRHAEAMAAYDAALARIAELDPLNKRIILKLHEIVNRNPHPDGSLGQNLEDVIDRQITALMRENELLGQHNARLQQRIAELERQVTGAHRNAIEAMLPTIPKVPEMIGLESSSLFPEEK